MSIESHLGQKQQSVKSPEEVKNSIVEELKTYGDQYKLRGLEGRALRGLDPAGMLAVKETRQKLETISAKLGAQIGDVIRMTNELHVGAIWKNADILAEGTRPDVKVWMVAAEVTNSGKDKEGDLTPEELVLDLKRINNLLDEAATDPQRFFERAKSNLIGRSKEQFHLDDGVPMSEFDGGFLAMAINGYKSGILSDKGGLLFVGANELDYGTLELLDLKSVDHIDDRNRMTTFYIDSSGKDIVKKLYPGFAIVLNGDKEVAKKLARSAVAQSIA
ncbi:MAG: hypothetical protein HY226_05860 [Candidatus Vogelbacteria bacterium]|nr:hypothetical protein [Candidatus Vogelbacteria bacterium]